MADFERGVAYYGAHGLLLHLPAAEYYAAAYLGGQSAHGLDPRAETGLVLGLFGHEDGDAGYGVEWDIATRDYRLAVCGAEQLLDLAPMKVSITVALRCMPRIMRSTSRS